MKLYGNRGGRYAPQRATRKKKRNRKGMVGLLLLLITAALTVGALAFRHVRPPETVDPSQPPKDTVAVAQEQEQSIPAAPERKEDFVTVLLIGRDKVGLNTDVLMLMSYDTVNNKVSMMSIPRDTMVNVERKNKKINSAFSQGGKANLEELMAEVKSVVGFRPDFHLTVSVDAFVELIDEIGGVTVDVPVDMYYSDPEQGLKINIKKGVQTLDGYDAMGFMRFRATYARGDLERIDMQHKFIDAFMDKLVSPKTLTKIPNLAEILVKNVETDLTVGNLIWMAKKALTLNLAEDFHQFTLPGEAGYYKQLSYFMAYEKGTLELINSHFNPFVNPITDLDLPHVKLANGLYSDQLDKEETIQ